MKCRVFIELTTGLVHSSVTAPDFVMEAQPIPDDCHDLYVEHHCLPTRDSHYFDGEELVSMPPKNRATDLWDVNAKRWTANPAAAAQEPALADQVKAIWAELQAQPGGLKSELAKSVAQRLASRK